MKKALFLILILVLANLGFSAQSEVIHYKKLQEFLPKVELPGFVREDPVGSIATTMGGKGASLALVRYKGMMEGKIENDQSIEITISDIGSNQLSALADLYQSMEFENQTEDGYEKTVMVKGKYKAIEKAQTGVYKSCTLEFLLAGRFSITIEGSGFDDATILRTLAESMKLDKLAELAQSEPH